MANTSLKRIRAFIEMYDMEDVISVEDDEFGCQVYQRVNEDDTNVYECRNITAAAECVNDIIFDLPMNVTEVPPTGKDKKCDV